MSGHTPGPWNVEGACVVSAGSGVIVRQAAPYDDALNDLRLIAAAPMLLKACELFAEYDAVEHDDFETMVTAYAEAIEATRAALAAATGDKS